VIAATGEDAIVYCPNSDYAANMEKAEALGPALAPRSAPTQAMAQVRNARQEYLCWMSQTSLGLPLSSSR